MNKNVFRNIKQAVKICILVIQNILVYFFGKQNYSVAGVIGGWGQGLL